MTRDEALETLALACLVRAVKYPDSGDQFGAELAERGVSLGDTAAIVARMMRFGTRAVRDYAEAVRALGGV